MAYNNIGYQYFKEKEYDLAIMYYTMAITIYPQYSNAYRGRADAKNAQGKTNEACEDIKKAKELGSIKAAKYYDEYCLK